MLRERELNTLISHLEQDKELKDSPEGRRKEAGIRHSHLEEQSMEEAVADVDEGVLVHVGVPDPVGAHVVVDWNVVICLVLRHDLQISWLRLHTLTADSRSACLFRGQENLTSGQLEGGPLLDGIRTFINNSG